MRRLVRVLLIVGVIGTLLTVAGVGMVVWAMRDPEVTTPAGLIAEDARVRMDGRTFRATVVRPRSVASGTAPVVALAHGYTRRPIHYRSIIDRIAARGYVVIAPDTQTGLRPDGGALADDLWRAIRWARAEYPEADPVRDAVIGHSMGGASAIMAFGRYRQIDMLISIAASDIGDARRQAANGAGRPSAYIVGSDDRVVPPRITRGLYASQPSPAEWFELVGGSHCGFVRGIGLDATPCATGDLDRTVQFDMTVSLVTGLLDRHLRDGGPFDVPDGVRAERR